MRNKIFILKGYFEMFVFLRVLQNFVKYASYGTHLEDSLCILTAVFFLYGNKASANLQNFFELAVYKKQKKSPEVVLGNRYCQKFCNIQRKTPMPESF